MYLELLLAGLGWVAEYIEGEENVRENLDINRQ
jgi:hypothetical protein